MPAEAPVVEPESLVLDAAIWTQLPPTLRPWHELQTPASQVSPPARQAHSATWDQAAGRLLIFGGVGRNDLWRYSSAVEATGWRELTANGATGSPPVREHHAAAWDSTRHRLLVFGGQFGGSVANDLWAYSAAHGWRQLTANGQAGSPPPRRHHSAVWDSRAHRLLIYGGIGGDGSEKADVWQWQQFQGWSLVGLATTGGNLIRRSHHLAIWDEVEGRMLVFGGAASGAIRNDLWALTIPSPYSTQTEELVGNGDPSAPSGRTYFSGAWDAGDRRLLIFGGYDGNEEDGSYHRNDLWKWTAAGGWKQLTADGEQGSPRRRMSSDCAWDALHRQLLVFGGGTSDGSLADLWQYRGLLQLIP